MNKQTQDYITLKPISERFKEVAATISDDEIKSLIKEELREQIRTQVDFGSTIAQWVEDMLEDDRFIYGLSIPLIGRTASKAIANNFGYDYEQFRKYGIVTHYKGIDGFGDNMNDSIHDYLRRNHIMVEMLANEFTFTKKEKSDKTVNLSNKTFVITGSLNHYKNRDELVSVIEGLGGKVSGSVSSKTAYLINNDIQSNSSKNQKSKKLNIPIITEEDFIKMIS